MASESSNRQWNLFQFWFSYHHHIPWLSGKLQVLPMLKGIRLPRAEALTSHSGPYKKIPQILSIVVYNNRNEIFTFLEAEKFEIKVRAHFLVHRLPSFLFPHIGRELLLWGRGSLLQIHFMRVPYPWPNHLPKANHLLITACWWLGFKIWNLERHKHLISSRYNGRYLGFPLTMVMALPSLGREYGSYFWTFMWF